MSDFIKHECGIALVRLLKPLSFYQEKYGSALYGLEKLRLLMQKQRNRGQDGAGIATIKLQAAPGHKYISRKRSNASNYLDDLFGSVYAKHFEDLTEEQANDAEWLNANKPYVGELLLGHLRYGTHGDNTIETCHPFLRQNNWVNRNLILAGNFNLTNVDELFAELVELGQYPKEVSDTVTVLEKIGHFLDDEVQRLHTWFKPDGHSNIEINELIFENLDVHRLLRRASRKFDGGYVMAGLIGHGDSFVIRDPEGIRPAFAYQDDEVVVVASERPAIQTAFDVHVSKVHEIRPGNALVVKYNGKIIDKPFIEKRKRAALSLGKGVTMLVGVALSAYLGLQQAISERPTKGEVKEDLTRVEAAHAESEDRVDYIEREVMKIGGRVEALDKKVSEGFDEIKEELRYLRRQR